MMFGAFQGAPPWVRVLSAALTPNHDGTFSLLSRGQGSATFTRAQSKDVLDYQGNPQTVGIDVIAWEGARYTDGIPYWQLEDGTYLQPTISLDGVLLFARYPAWSAETGFSVGQRLEPDNGRYYEVIDSVGDGLTGTTAPVWPTDPAGFGNATVTDGGLTWLLKGYALIKGAYFEVAENESLTFPLSGNIDRTKGFCRADFEPSDWGALGAGAEIVGKGDGLVYLLAPDAANFVTAKDDGANTALGPAGAPAGQIRAILEWDQGAAVMSVGYDGNIGAQVDYSDFNFVTLQVGYAFTGYIQNVLGLR